ncbi:6-phosphofructokinase [Streptomyces sp. NPDC051315]|uniref:6-phosphofructokinase n=1 Tax=Streptomyces sp. NPDC051315 TaxID=3365650 RepID=UPI00378DB542
MTPLRFDGEDTLGVAARLSGEYDVTCAGVPKTVGDDLSATDRTLGSDPAAGLAAEAVDRPHTTVRPAGPGHYGRPAGHGQRPRTDPGSVGTAEDGGPRLDAGAGVFFG